MHGCMGELALVPPEVDCRALVASRDGSYVPAVGDLMGAHFSFRGDQISPVKSGRDDKCPQVRCDLIAIRYLYSVPRGCQSRHRDTYEIMLSGSVSVFWGLASGYNTALY